ncbi:GNAT family N-acetyltransferase [Xylella fastidiosa subsp. morus]|uniref:GNAT family N-acetyltransferase n=1 Tax=Xylella fastidiosa TaxID=2371 RepID=UPI0003ECE11F|nr:hypothetical protein [Xylella fastidiosa]EWG13412.1 hypothetical protein P910_003340 [Xylella fastidiosa Mul-MD]UIN27044.1 GNAT family N-acetyltransferase [Xylella fastidiosa subsp. morus]UIT37715.1 GNAT family N-acetyltransferase [Xylella fastidiosa subsp. morus]UIT40010.1 GNAT family N-acetyltransferase [Xylella fastidiosa subsp. morus]UIT43105.1 GNAT family N-acetyltransferase [Xylella fastidiosa subsp. morus]
MKRATLASANHWLNDPRILPAIANHPLDLSAVWQHVVMFEFTAGTVGFHHGGDGQWSMHLCLVPGSGTAHACVKRALRAVFRRSDCLRIQCAPCSNNIRAVRFMHKTGFRCTGQHGAFTVFLLEKPTFFLEQS